MCESQQDDGMYVCIHSRMYDDRPASIKQYLRIFTERGILEVWKMQVIKAKETMWEVVTHSHLLVHQHLITHLPDHLMSGSVVLLDIILQDGDCVMQLDTPVARQWRMEGHDFAREVRASRANVLATAPAFSVP